MTFLEQNSIGGVTTPELHPFDILTKKFQHSVIQMTEKPLAMQTMLKALQEFNPLFKPIVYPKCSEAETLGNVVAAIYAPLILGYAAFVLRNIEDELLPNIIIAPPRDAFPLVTAIQTLADIKGVPLTILMPPINRNTAGIANNQKNVLSAPSPLLETLFDQISQVPQISQGVVEIETGIYGTTSLVMAKALKKRGITSYVPIKFYGLGPNLSYVHAVMSGGKGWIAEDVESMGHVSKSEIDILMVLLDTMEELGMEKYYKSIENLKLDEKGMVVPIILPTSAKEYEIAQVTNSVIRKCAPVYMDLPPEHFASILSKIPLLIELSRQGFPFTLEDSIPPMDSKEDHFSKMRSSGVINYPQNLVL